MAAIGAAFMVNAAIDLPTLPKAGLAALVAAIVMAIVVRLNRRQPDPPRDGG
jgi:hypothetical protein